jgi:hypothetical protein
MQTNRNLARDFRPYSFNLSIEIIKNYRPKSSINYIWNSVNPKQWKFRPQVDRLSSNGRLSNNEHNNKDPRQSFHDVTMKFFCYPTIDQKNIL